MEPLGRGPAGLVAPPVIPGGGGGGGVAEELLDRREIGAGVEEVPGVLHHDPVVVAGGRRLEIKTTDLDDLLTAKPDLATMDEVLQAFPGVPLTVEVKAPNAAEPAVRKLADETNERAVIVTSFSAAIVRAVARASRNQPVDTAPAWPTILLYWLLSRIGVSLPVGRRHVAVQVPLRLDGVAVVKHVPLLRNLRLCDRRFVRAAHTRGLAVHVWTLDEEGDMAQALDADADGIMTDRPSVLMQLLERRGGGWSG